MPALMKRTARSYQIARAGIWEQTGQTKAASGANDSEIPG